MEKTIQELFRDALQTAAVNLKATVLFLDVARSATPSALTKHVVTFHGEAENLLNRINDFGENNGIAMPPHGVEHVLKPKSR